MERLQNDQNDTLLSVPLEKHAFNRTSEIYLAFSDTRVTRFITSILLATRLQKEGNKEQGRYISVLLSVPLAGNTHCRGSISLGQHKKIYIFLLGLHSWCLNRQIRQHVRPISGDVTKKLISYCSASTLDVIEIAQIVKFANTLAHLWWCNLHKNRQNRQIRKHVRPISFNGQIRLHVICTNIAKIVKFATTSGLSLLM